MTTADLYLLAPELSMVGLASLVVVLDLVLGPRRFLGAVAVIGLLLPATLTVMLWGEVAGWWSFLEPLPGAVAGRPIPNVGITGTVAIA